MNRVTFLFLALLIGSSIMTVNSRHQARTLITEKEVLQDKVTTLKESLRRLELTNARLAAHELPQPAIACVPATSDKPGAAKGESLDSEDAAADDTGDVINDAPAGNVVKPVAAKAPEHKAEAKPAAKTDAPKPLSTVVKHGDVKPAAKPVVKPAPKPVPAAAPAVAKPVPAPTKTADDILNGM